MKQEEKKGEPKIRDVFFARAHPTSIVGIMLKHGHHSKLLHYGTQTIPADRHCESCGATTESEEAQRLCPAAEMIHIDVHREETNVIVEQLAGGSSLKKVRRMFKRSIERETSRAVDQRLEQLEKLIKERPAYIPEWLWTRIKGLVLRDRIDV